MISRVNLRQVICNKRLISTSFKRMSLDPEEKPCKCTPDEKPKDISKDFGPLATLMHNTLTEELSPTLLDIKNDSWKHAHHAPMQGNANTVESHFKVTISSQKFEGLNALKRHRLVYGLLKDAGVLGDGSKTDGKVHALQIDARVP